MRLGLFGRSDRLEARAVAIGAERLGWAVVWQRPGVWTEDQYQPFDAVLTFGLQVQSGRVRETYRAHATPCLVLDLPALRIDGYWALWPGELNRLPDSAPADRLGMVPFGRAPLGDAILVCGQKGGDAAHHMDSGGVHAWALKTAQWLRWKVGQDARIVWRPHPQQRFELPRTEYDDGKRSVEDVLESGEVRAMVTHNSTCGIAALARGVPVYADECACYAEVAHDGLPGRFAEGLPAPDRVEDFFSRLTHTQWTLEEIETGAPLAETLERCEEWH